MEEVGYGAADGRQGVGSSWVKAESSGEWQNKDINPVRHGMVSGKPGAEWTGSVG